MRIFKERMPARSFRVTTYQLRKNDYEFTLGGITYYTDAAVGRDKTFLTIVALDELKAANKKIAALEKKLETIRAFI